MSTAFFDISIGNENKGRILFQLFEHIAPKTTNNFKQLCIGDKKNSDGIQLSYKNCIFHRVISGFMCQSGDFTNHNGTGGDSIYGGKFNDEKFIKSFDKPYLLAMANSGPNTNKSQFFITFDKLPHLNNKHVIFGEVVHGFDLIKLIEKVPTDSRDCPMKDVAITDCGIVTSSKSISSNQIHSPIYEQETSIEKKVKNKKEKKTKKSKKGIIEDDDDNNIKSFEVPQTVTLSNIALVKDLYPTVLPSSNKEKSIDKPSNTYIGNDGITYKGRGRIAYKPNYSRDYYDNYDARNDIEWRKSSRRWDDRDDRYYQDKRYDYEIYRSRSRSPDRRRKSSFRRSRSRSLQRNVHTKDSVYDESNNEN